MKHRLLRAFCLVLLAVVFLPILPGCASKPSQGARAAGAVTSGGADATATAVNEAEAHSRAAVAANIDAYSVVDGLMNRPADTPGMPNLRQAAETIRRSLKTVRTEIAVARSAIQVLHESAGRSDYLASLQAQTEVADALEGLAALLDNEGGRTVASLKAGTTEDEISSLSDKLSNAMERADKLRRQSLTELGFASLASTGTPTPAAPDPAAASRPPQSPDDDLHTSDVRVSGDEVAVITTNKGVIKFKFYPKDAPNTVASFMELADEKFYDGTKWHRVVPSFVIQGGDPLSKTDDPAVGTGGPDWRQKAEFNSQKHLLGTVAMARSQAPDSAGSQFYICLAPQPSLDGQYTVFGQVTSGMDVVQKIQQGDVITSIRIERGE